MAQGVRLEAVRAHGRGLRFLGLAAEIRALKAQGLQSDYSNPSHTRRRRNHPQNIKKKPPKSRFNIKDGEGRGV